MAKKSNDLAVGFALGAHTVLAIGCTCWLRFTDLILTDFDTGDRGLGLWGTLGIPSVWIAWSIGVVSSGGLIYGRFRRSSAVGLIASLVFLGLFAFVLMARWSRPMWRVM